MNDNDFLLAVAAQLKKLDIPTQHIEHEPLDIMDDGNFVTFPPELALGIGFRCTVQNNKFFLTENGFQRIGRLTKNSSPTDIAVLVSQVFKPKFKAEKSKLKIANFLGYDHTYIRFKNGTVKVDDKIHISLSFSPEEKQKALRLVGLLEIFDVED